MRSKNLKRSSLSSSSRTPRLIVKLIITNSVITTAHLKTTLSLRLCTSFPPLKAIYLMPRRRALSLVASRVYLKYQVLLMSRFNKLLSRHRYSIRTTCPRIKCLPHIKNRRKSRFCLAVIHLATLTYFKVKSQRSSTRARAVSELQVCCSRLRLVASDS